MDAVRCPECGDVRWSFFGFGSGRPAPMTCELCGADMVPERRRPSGMHPPIEARERRLASLTPAGPGSPTVPPAA